MDGRVSSLLSSTVYPIEHPSNALSIYTSYHILPETTNPDVHMSSITLTYLSLIAFISCWQDTSIRISLSSYQIKLDLHRVPISRVVGYSSREWPCSNKEPMSTNQYQSLFTSSGVATRDVMPF